MWGGGIGHTREVREGKEKRNKERKQRVMKGNKEG